ncbi:MAG: glycosyltransferase [Gammaproteobacteria bacterium]|nr:glycosyltransferase [Gammaproteobacteria bacterium]
MKIVHVITGLDQGGAEAMLEKLVLTGRRMNPEVEQRVISLRQSGAVGARLMRAGIAVESLDLKLSLRSFRRLAPLLRRLHQEPELPVIQTWLWHADLLGGVCARIAGNPKVVWNLRNSMPAHAATKRMSRLAARVCAVLSSRVPRLIICNSQAALRAHVAIGYRADRCLVIPNGFDLRTFAPSAGARDEVRARWGALPEQPVVGMVARVDPLKDHQTFIAAAARVAPAAPLARFVLVGEGVTRDEAIRHALERTTISGRFILEERSERVADVMSALDIFCLASRSEGFPNVVGEAMACALPTIGSDVGDLRYIVGDDRLVATAADAASLADRLAYVLALSVEERRALGSTMRQRIESEFDIERAWRSYLEVYGSVADVDRALQRLS